ncbi:hypothetical protein CASFOL_034183 [Castilleja foliolosa]|uniref:Uncharacterized protein n=1 Tax=Castilleja foliolosa TaxID=1961234 RepID=A0ABD3BXG8_9LAMI
MEMKREGYFGRGKGRIWPIMHHSRKQVSNGVCVPDIPLWEKEFCYEIGSFTWKHFLDAKKNAIDYSSEKIMEWDDSAAEEAFHNAKKMFYAEKFNWPSVISGVNDYSPDLYIDEIKWDDDDREQLLRDRDAKKILRGRKFWRKIFPFI